ncbi:MAG: molybdopterin converting factor subunit 1 [Rhodocyclaceae bacterium]|nr:molybdopterin converting factor subunit 1 [Rhodocyclaceae bacterium]MBX3670524.1 molybdopterin converting factor subunit 1 [Rhodocyclaceae bacterium]
MMVKILYFAALRERLERSEEQLALPPEVATAGALRAHLAARGGAWEALANLRNLRVAVNQRMAGADAPLADGDEVAFFPPVTGG